MLPAVCLTVIPRVTYHVFMRTCKNCTKEIKETNDFCSSSCAATYNNKHHIKRKRTKKCQGCENLVTSRYTYCQDCIFQGKHLRGGIPAKNKPLSYYANKRQDANRYCYIRQQAQKITASWPPKCKICGYDKHVETCHLRDISDFPLTATLQEINHPDNLALLCCNHHWEFDHGLLKF